ncbi:hypothetical protein [Streptomyces sp. NPDC086989]|uniref:hypothetical protein n=1 Tax=Streptomyces sp. NPDC086989 TaxID=3365764 RepID=UPI00382D08AC
MSRWRWSLATAPRCTPCPSARPSSRSGPWSSCAEVRRESAYEGAAARALAALALARRRAGAWAPVSP